VDRRRIELQLRAIVVTYRIERRRRDSPTMEGFRERARSLLHSLDEEVRPYPDLQAALLDAHRELDGEEPSSSGVGDGLPDVRQSSLDREPSVPEGAEAGGGPT